MSFDAQESSAYGGSPIEVYEFRVGSDEYLFTSGPDAITVDSLDYTPAPIKRSNRIISPSERIPTLVIVLPTAEAFARSYIGIVPGQRASCTVKRVHYTDGALQSRLITKGFVTSMAYSADGTVAQVAVTPFEGLRRKTMPRDSYQGLCNNFLYDGRCKVVEADYRLTNTVAGVSGNVYTVAGADAEADGFYTGGMISSGSTDFRLILDHVGTDLTVGLPFREDLTGQTVDVVAGCDHDIVTCDEKFDNLINHNGFGFSPELNIFQVGIS